jgi:hypothetical protein
MTEAGQYRSNAASIRGHSIGITCKTPPPRIIAQQSTWSDMWVFGDGLEAPDVTGCGPLAPTLMPQGDPIGGNHSQRGESLGARHTYEAG